MSCMHTHAAASVLVVGERCRLDLRQTRRCLDYMFGLIFDLFEVWVSGYDKSPLQ